MISTMLDRYGKHECRDYINMYAYEYVWARKHLFYIYAYIIYKLWSFFVRLATPFILGSSWLIFNIGYFAFRWHSIYLCVL